VEKKGGWSHSGNHDLYLEIIQGSACAIPKNLSSSLDYTTKCFACCWVVRPMPVPKAEGPTRFKLVGLYYLNIVTLKFEVILTVHRR